MSRLMSAIAVAWSGVRSNSNASSNSSCQCVSAPNAWPGHRLARGVELEQLLGHVAHGLLDLGLGLLPGRAAKPIERRLRSAGVFLDQIEALDRHEQLRVAVIAELEELLDDVAAGDGDLLEADELADAVIDVDDQIVDLEIAQVGEERGGGRSLLARAGLAPLFIEDIGFGVNLKRWRPESCGWPETCEAETLATASLRRPSRRRGSHRRRPTPSPRGRRSPSAARRCARRGRASRRRRRRDRRSACAALTSLIQSGMRP